MHYRNGREAKNGDKVVKLAAGEIVCFGVLHSAVTGNDYCNGSIAPITNDAGACICDMLHVDDIASLLKASGFTFHKCGMEPHAITVFKAGTSDPATPEEIDVLLQRLNAPGLDKRPGK